MIMATTVPKSDLERAYLALREKQTPYTELWDYYDGSHPQAYLSKRLKEIFRGLNSILVENWCEVVVSSKLNKLNLDTLGHENESVADGLQQVWDANLGDVLTAEVHEALLVIGETYVIAWPDDATGELDIAHNDPRRAHLFYLADRPTVKWYGAKWWDDENEQARLVLYYPDRLEYYRAERGIGDIGSADSFEPDGVAANPLGVVPFFHFRATRRAIKGELVNALPIQDGINKLLADMLVVAEYMAGPQRWVIANADTDNLKSGPGQLWTIPAGDGTGQQTSVGQFEPADLQNFLVVIDNLVNALATITATPKHYFFQQGGAPSGEALIAEEAPLNARVERYQRMCVPIWQELGAFVALLTGLGDVPASEITPKYAPAATVQPRTAAEIMQMRVAAGIPLASVLAMEGYSEAEIDEIMAAKEQEDQARQRTLGQALLEAERRRDNQRPPEEE